MVTSNRSDWSKLQPVANKLLQKSHIDLHVIALGSHMLVELGNTREGIRAEFPKTYELHTLVAGNSVEAMTDSVGFGIIKITSMFKTIKPDVVVIHGDRFDAFSAAIAANMLNYTIAHLEGGELSGTVDGTIRHALTKLSHIHFTCTYEAQRRVRAMGELPSSVYLTGCPSYDNLFSLLSTDSWEECQVAKLVDDKELHFSPKAFQLVLMHPVTDCDGTDTKAYEVLTSALFRRKKKTVMFYPNIDPGNKTLIQILHKYQREDPGWPSWLRILTHVPPKIFMSLMKEATVMLGNSSAGIRESCIFGTPTLNIGTRQVGRRTPHNVTSLVSPSDLQILEWLALHEKLRYPCSEMYGFPDSSQRVADVLARKDVREAHKKFFFEPTYALHPCPLQGSGKQTPSPAEKILNSELKVLGLITAREGSKGIPGKNIVDLNGRPMLWYTIEAALKAQGINRVIVSTDSKEIGNLAASLGCEVPFLRPRALAQDNSTHLSVVLHALDTLYDIDGYEPDCVMLLQPTSPFRTSQDIDESIDLIKKTNCDLVVGVSPSSANLSKLLYVTSSGVLQPFAEVTSDTKYTRRQDLPETYAENGAIFLQRASSLRFPPQHVPNFGSLRSVDARAYVMPEERSLDIDTPFDLHLARLVMATPYETT